MKLIEAISLRIDELLDEKNMTQYRLGMESGVPAASISEIRHMKNRTTSMHIIYDIAQGFGMDLPEFFDSPLFRDGNITD